MIHTDLEENIIQTLMGSSMTVNQLQRKFPNRKNSLIKTYKKMARNGILNQTKQGNRILLSLSEPKFDNSLRMVMSSLPLAEKRAGEFMKKLHKQKPIFLKQNFKDGEKVTFQMKPYNKKYLNQILVILNDLVLRSVSLTYAQCLNAVPKGSNKIVRQYHKNCIRTIRKIISTLEHEHKDSELQLGSYLYYGIHGYNHLTTLEAMNK